MLINLNTLLKSFQIIMSVLAENYYLTLKRNSTTTVYAIDNLLVVNSKIEKIPSPLNPHQFDYSSI